MLYASIVGVWLARAIAASTVALCGSALRAGTDVLCQ